MLQAAFLECGACDGGDTIGVTLYADDYSPFAHGHVELAEAELWLAELAAAVQELRERQGIKLS